MSNKLLYKLKSASIIIAGSLGVSAGLQIYEGNKTFYKHFIIPIVHKLDPELAHNVALYATKFNLLPKSRFKDPESLKTHIFSLDFSNPLGIAAGFDKHGDGIKNLHELGFGFVEIGSITPKPQTGNEKPRVFRLEDDKAVINRYGFNSEGHDCVLEKIIKLRNSETFNGIIGINLGKNKDALDPFQDYIDGVHKFNDVADYLVINISSPNTPGLRNLQLKDQLQDLLEKLISIRNSKQKKTPLLLKLAPDLSAQERKDIAKIVLKEKSRIDGLIVSNTTIQRDPSLKSTKRNEQGGLSGAPLSKLSTEMIKEMYRLTEGKIPIIGVGGIFSAKDAYEKIEAGASLIQIYTSFVYNGPPIVTEIKNDLDVLLKKAGYSKISDLVGTHT